jgi:hypothetical protein
VNVTWSDLDSFTFILHFLIQIWIEGRLVCNFCEAVAGSLFSATTAVSSVEFAVVVSGETGRSESESESQSHVTTDGQPVSQSWCRAPSGTHDQMFVAV